MSNHALRQFQRDIFVTLRIVRIPWCILIFIVGLGATIIAWCSPDTKSISHSIYQVMTLSFLNPITPFPEHGFVQLVFFLAPLVGLSSGIELLRGTTVAIIARQKRSQSWETELARSCKDAIIVCGLGRVGVEVVRRLEPIYYDRLIAIEKDPLQPGVEEVQALGIPVIIGDMQRTSTLKNANFIDAAMFILTGEDDLVHAKTILKLKEKLPGHRNIPIIYRAFDTQYADQIKMFVSEGKSQSVCPIPVDVSRIIAKEITKHFHPPESPGRIAIVGLGKVGFAVVKKLLGDEHSVLPEQISIFDRNMESNRYAKKSPCNLIQDKQCEDAIELCDKLNNYDIVVVATEDDLTNLVFSNARKLGKVATVLRTKYVTTNSKHETVFIVSTTNVSADSLMEEVVARLAK